MFDVEATSDLLLPDGRPIGVMNTTTLGLGEIAGNREVKALATQLGQWVETARARGGDPAGMFNRSLYTAPTTPYAQMRVARHAVRNDDIVSLVADASEAMAFDGGLKWESANPDDADVFNQLSADLNLDGKIREMWREVFTVDQAIVVKLWDTVTYTVRGITEQGNRKKKKYTIYAPTQLTMLKPENVVPIGYGPLRQDNLAWQATGAEIGNYENVIGSGTSDNIDPLMRAFFTGQYRPGPDESGEMAQWGVNQERLLAMNPDWVFRHTSTRPDYAKFPDIRLSSVFGLLDLKRQLIASDRATLIGAANYILLIRKGSKEQPATQDEVNNLKAGYNFLAKLPVIISDHRLEIDVIAPKLDFVLKKDSYDQLDHRILARCLSTFTSTATRAGTTDIFGSVLATAVQNRRHMLKRTLEREIARAVVEHPKNAGLFEQRPSLVFTPQTVAIGVNQFELQAMLALRTQREISRDTILEYLGLDQATEAQRLEVEEKFFDSIFKTQIPFAAPGAGGNQQDTRQSDQPPGDTPAKTTEQKPAEPPATSGRRGGRPAGGGRTPASPANQATPRTPNGNKSTSEGIK